MSKKPRFTTPFDSQHVKHSEKHPQSTSSYCFITFAKIELENLGLSVSEILGVLFNTLTANEQYSLRNRKNLRQPIQLQLSKKHIFFFFLFFARYLRSTSNG